MTKTLRKILCVDDENDIVQVTRLSLENVGGYEVFSCSSGSEALEKVESINPDLILLDAMMPQMDGPTTLQELHKHQAWKLIPIIFMTARVQPREVEEYLQMGASGVISKPFDPMTLSGEIAGQWEKFHSRRKAAFEAMMVPLRQEYLAHVKTVLADFDAVAIRLASAQSSPDELAALAQKAHSLVGSGSTYGFEAITRTARQLELAIHEKKASPGGAELPTLLGELRKACSEALASAA